MPQSSQGSHHLRHSTTAFPACEIYARLSILFWAARNRARQFVWSQDAGHRKNPELH